MSIVNLKEKENMSLDIKTISKVNLMKEVPVTVSPRKKVNLDKTDAIEKSKKEKQVKLLNKLFEEYTQDLHRFIEHKVFIPDPVDCDSVLLINKLLNYLEEKTGYYFMSYPFFEGIISGNFIMRAKCLLDKNGVYTHLDDIVYSEDGKKYHVNYYRQYGVFYIILDNTESFKDFKVEYDLSTYSHKKPIKQKQYTHDKEEVVNNHSYTISHVVVDNKSEYTTNNKEVLAINEKVTIKEKDSDCHKTSLFSNIDFYMTIDVNYSTFYTLVYSASAVTILLFSLGVVTPARKNLEGALCYGTLLDETTLESSEVEVLNDIMRLEDATYPVVALLLVLVILIRFCKLIGYDLG